MSAQRQRILLFALIVGITLLLGLPVVHAQASNLQTTVTQAAVVRSGPGSEFDRLGTFRAGTAVALDGRNENGNWVRGISSGGLVGWISSGTINITFDQLTGLRIVQITTAFTLPPPSGAAPPPSSSGAPTGGSGAGLATSAITGVNIRSGPGTSFGRVGGLAAGQAFNVDGRDSSGGWVRGITGSGTIGWVSAYYVNLSANEISSLPVVNNATPFGASAPGGAAAPTGDTGAPITSTAPVTGFSYGGHVQGFGDSAAQWMRVAGMTWAKRQWRYIDGQSPDSVSGMIAQAHGRGFRILIGVVGQNAGDVNNPGYADRFASFVAGVARLGADAIEIWNEPNLPREWSPVSPAAYTNLLRASYQAIKAVNPNTLVISGALAPTGFFGGCSAGGCDDNQFLAGMNSAGASSYMDCVGIHYNEGILPPTATSGDPRGNSGHYTRYYQGMVNVYWNAFGGRRSLCFTELGYLSPEGYPPLPGSFGWAQNVTVAQQAAWLDQVVSIARNSGRVRLMIIWNVDFTQYGSDPMAGYAMIRPGGGCPACEALGR
jgi:uncharacterized protein YraI